MDIGNAQSPAVAVAAAQLGRQGAELRVPPPEVPSRRRAESVPTAESQLRSGTQLAYSKELNRTFVQFLDRHTGEVVATFPADLLSAPVIASRDEAAATHRLDRLV